MPLADHARRFRQRLARAYHLACVRDDVASRGVIVPTGVWVCDRCRLVLLEAAALREHLRVEHAVP